MEIDKGRFIVLEGGEGGGKSSLMLALVEHLRAMGKTVYATREPGGTDISTQIRAVIVNLKNKEMNSRTETLLFQAARAQLVEQEIKPRLKKGEIIVSDRFAESTVAYQVYGHGQDMETVNFLINFATGGLRPDLAIFIKVRPEIGLTRKRASSEWNRLDAHEIEFHNKVYHGYEEMVRAEPQRWRVVNAEKGFEEVRADLINTVSEYLRLPGVARLGMIDI